MSTEQRVSRESVRRRVERLFVRWRGWIEVEDGHAGRTPILVSMWAGRSDRAAVECVRLLNACKINNCAKLAQATQARGRTSSYAN